MTCPKCSAPMRTYERNAVHVDQCTDCRGIFLDRGELERLIDAENSWNGRQPAAAPRYDDRRSYGHGQPRRKKSFLSELFD